MRFFTTINIKVPVRYDDSTLFSTTRDLRWTSSPLPNVVFKVESIGSTANFVVNL